MNQKRYWLRGGIVGLILVFIILILSGIYFFFCFRSYGELPSYCSSINFLNYPEHYLLFLDSLVSNLAFYIGFGVILGWLYGKIKNRNIVK
ncbi:hypothetical protein A3A03_00415 [Candidatus Nomurabacteria bacterium RIFCSPLOWO2_01_FULL_40_18]|uniref:Uncharacterized protein n=1 Tax=Candidatus Nomurabacteria bacterium RIFCSPLOWO2_01_FULL_40_18 TaxID=1801773 RepID=A0A1F6XH93_9BACT|nr:MAG: hypothetical protein A3A03_00415 [Candidatus Nomurabacteria bacterium RIFCSPLOWO2_01_FULL_40_18]